MEKQRTTVFVKGAFVGSEFTARIDIPFIPRTVTVNNVLTTQTPPLNGIDFVTTDLLNGSGTLDSILFGYYLHSDTVHNPNLTFNLNGPVNGIYKFRSGLDSNIAVSFALTFSE